MPEKDELDLLLDSALATYADPGPESGLERRVLTALAAERASRRERTAGRWLPWAIVIPVAASLLLWAFIANTHRGPSISSEQARRSDRGQTPAINIPQPAVRPDVRSGIHPSGTKAHAHSGPLTAPRKSCLDTKPDSFAKTAEASTLCSKPAPPVSAETLATQSLPLPKLDVFPTPQPLTPQERALAAVATQSPAPVRAALIEAQKRDDVPVRIAAIHIPPIELSSQTQP